MQTEFNFQKGQQLKEIGISKTITVWSDNYLKQLQDIAEQLGQDGAVITINNVIKAWELKHHMPAENPKVHGSVFNTKKWECVGIECSDKVARRCGVIRKWRLRNEV